MYVSKWFEDGLIEIGLTKEKFLMMTEIEQDKTRKYLEELGHY